MSSGMEQANELMRSFVQCKALRDQATWPDHGQSVKERESDNVLIFRDGSFIFPVRA